MIQPLVSVIIPTYNRPETLRRAVQSVLDQNYPNIEILIVDDASASPPKEAESWGEQIRVILNPENKGPSYCRNLGLKESRGEYINFLDDDDVFFPDKIRLQVERFSTTAQSKAGFITCHAEDQRSGELIIQYNKVRGDIHRLLLHKFAISGIETVLYRKEALLQVSGFDESLKANEEYDLLIRLSEEYDCDFVDEILTREYHSEGANHINFPKRIEGIQILYNKHQDRFFEQGFLFGMGVSLKYGLLLLRYQAGRFLGVPFYRWLLRVTRI